MDIDVILKALRRKYDETEPIYFFARTLFRESADLIESLRAEADRLRRERDAAVTRLAELAAADAEGRVHIAPHATDTPVWLPFKVGDTVYTNFSMSGWYFRSKDKPYKAKIVFIGLNNSGDMGGGFVNVVYGKRDHMMQFNFSHFGRTVFLTREAAEAALKGADNAND